MRWWVLIIFGCLLLSLTTNITVALVTFVCVFVAFWFAQMKRINFLLAKIQEGVQKLGKILPKWFPQN